MQLSVHAWLQLLRMEFPGLDDDEQVIPELTTPSALSMGGTDSVLATVRRIDVLIFLPEAVLTRLVNACRKRQVARWGRRSGLRTRRTKI